MTTVILLTQKDIVSYRCGNHFEIRGEHITINFTPDAVDEFIRDVAAMRELEKHKQDETTQS